MTGLFLPFNYVILQAAAAGMDPGLVPYILPILNAARWVVAPLFSFHVVLPLEPTGIPSFVQHTTNNSSAQHLWTNCTWNCR